MANWASLGLGAKAGIVGVVAVVVVAVVTAVLRSNPTSAPPVALLSAPEPQAVAPPAPETPPTPQAPPAITLPTVDTFSLSADGGAVLAGRGQGGHAINVLLQGQQIASGQIDPRGRFAVLFDIPPSETPRVLTLAQAGPDGQTLSGDYSLIIAPFAVASSDAADPPVATPAPVEPAPAPADATGTAPDAPAPEAGAPPPQDP